MHDPQSSTPACHCSARVFLQVDAGTEWGQLSAAENSDRPPNLRSAFLCASDLRGHLCCNIRGAALRDCAVSKIFPSNSNAIYRLKASRDRLGDVSCLVFL